MKPPTDLRICDGSGLCKYDDMSHMIRRSQLQAKRHDRQVIGLIDQYTHPEALYLTVEMVNGVVIFTCLYMIVYFSSRFNGKLHV